MKTNGTMPWNMRSEIFIINCGTADLDSHLFFYLCQNILKSAYTSNAPGRIKIFTILSLDRDNSRISKSWIIFLRRKQGKNEKEGW